MTGNSNPADFVHIHRPKRWVLAVNIFSLVFMWIVLGIPLLSMTLLLALPNPNKAGTGFIYICLVPFIALAGLLLIMQTAAVILVFFSYIKTTPQGLEQKNWPYKHIRCNWSEVDRIGNLLFQDGIHLKSCEVMGPSLSLKMPFRLLRPSRGFIALSSYNGWPNGGLAEDLRKFAPTAFEGRPDARESAVSGKQERSDLSREERLLAALSHILILFPSIGVIVTFCIWAARKSKSSFIGFQALQALIWQAISLAFTLTISACMVGIIFIPLIIATASQNGRAPGSAYGVWFLVTLLSAAIIIVLGRFAFSIYGIIGAIMTYQGKGFRYAIVAKQMEKRTPTN